MTGTTTAYCVFIDTLCEGSTPAIRDADDKPVIFATLGEAEREIADNLMSRLQEFIDGEREFEDAMTVEDYIVEVTPLPDGSIIDKAGNWHGSRRFANSRRRRR
jgi:hypothetical protein